MSRALHALEPAAPWRSGPAARSAGATEAAPGIGAVEFMAGQRWFKTVPQSRAEIHGALVKGVPYALLVNLVAQLTALKAEEVADAVGISARTLRRQKDQPGKLMPPDLASRTWQLAELMVQASAVFGSRAEAERWMARPATGLDGARPIDLLRTLQGAELVTEFLGRLEHGVYS